MADELYRDLVAWATKLNDAPWTQGALVDPVVPGIYTVQPQLILDWDVFHERGLELAKRLKAETGQMFRVVYRKGFDDPDWCHEKRREVLDDGAVVVLPRRLPGGTMGRGGAP